MRTIEYKELSMSKVKSMLAAAAKHYSLTFNSHYILSDMKYIIDDMKHYKTSRGSLYIAIRECGVEHSNIEQDVIERCNSLGKPIMTYKVTFTANNIDVLVRII